MTVLALVKGHCRARTEQPHRPRSTTFWGAKQQKTTLSEWNGIEWEK